MYKGYWTRRQTRRTFLGTASAAGAGAAALAIAGCGDDDGGKAPLQLATPTASTSAVVDPFKDAKRGGILKLDMSADPPTIDPYGNVAVTTKTVANHVYSRLMKYKTGPQYPAGKVRPTGDLAETIEGSPDGLKWTFKLRKGVKFQNVAPVNGRAITTDDVKFSWAKATDAKNGNRFQLAFVDKLEYPDASTIVMTLKAPNAAFTDVMADASLLYIVPTESDGGFNPAKQMIGSGPWILENYTPSTSFKFKKNPDWYETGFPLMDGIDYSIIPDYSNRLTQFRAGSTDSTGINANDVVDMKKTVKDSQFGPDASVGASAMWFDSDPNSPWSKDERVRRALSMALDRDGLTELAFNVKAIKAAGIDAGILYNNIIPISVKRWWLDPLSKDQGETTKYFKYDPAEAKKLLIAAGYPNGIDVTYNYSANVYGNEYLLIAEANIAMMRAAGFNTTTDAQDYNSKYITQTFIGNFKGITFGLETSFPEGSGYVLRYFTPDDPNNHGRIKDPEMAKLAVQQQSELNEEARKQIFWDIQRKNAEHMFYVPTQAGAGTRWVVYQGNLHNGVEFYQQGYGGATERMPYRWKSS